MLVEIIENAAAVLLLIRSHLLKIVLASVKIILLLRISYPAATRKIRRAQHAGGRIGQLDHCGIRFAKSNDLGISRAIGHHVAVGVVPAGWLVIQLVVWHSAIGCGSECADQMLDPALLKRHAVVDMIGVDIVVDELDAIERNAVTAGLAARMIVGIDLLLRTVN
ncbi:MAG TPA: hypothetical protein VKS20_11790 [Candidatus Acidoferrales bacterium]|nr:hypothetical protein [Candidatus Acidoferrales bacterium]